MTNNFKQKDIDEYILSNIDCLQQIFSSFNYPNFSNFMKLLKEEFSWQSKLITHLRKESPNYHPVIIDMDIK